jgi:hypothetical protein
MTLDDTFAEAVGFVGWDPPEGAHELLVAVWPTPTSSKIWPTAVTHAESRLRALSDGSPQLMLRNSAGARVVRLGAESARVAIQSTAESLVDAVMTPNESVVVLEQVDHRTFDTRCVTLDGATIWKYTYAAEPRGRGGVKYDSRLLADSRGRVFISTHGSLIQVDGTGSTVVARWSGMPAVLCPDGRIGYVRNGPSRTRYWVVLDVDTSADTTTELSPETREVLDDVIGVDAMGRVYWRSFGKVTRMLPGGEIDWLVTWGGIAVSEGYGATILTFGENKHVVRFDNGGRVSIDLSSGDLDDSLGRLAGRTDDGGYILYKTVQGTYGKLSYLDRYGRLIRTELAPDDVWLTTDSAQWPDFSSVTPDGSVLVAVRSKLGIHVVRLMTERPGDVADTTGSS